MLRKHFIEVAPTQISSWRSQAGLQGIKVKRINTFITKKEIVLQVIPQLGNLLLQKLQVTKELKCKVETFILQYGACKQYPGFTAHIPHLQ